MGLNASGIRAAVLVAVLGLAFFGLFEILGYAEDLGDLAFIALMVMPVVAYGVGSGMVQEFSAPGGWGAKFHEVANDTVDPRPTSVDPGAADIEQLEIVTKGGPVNLRRQMDRVGGDENIALTLVMGRQGAYSALGIETYLAGLLAQGEGLSVVLVDDAGRFLASTTGPKLLTVLRASDGSDTPQAVIRAIETPAPEGLDLLDGIVALKRSSLASDVSNADALRQMVESDSNAMIVTGRDGHPSGIVRRDDIIAKMLLKLAAD